MGSMTVEEDQVRTVDWSRYTIDIGVEGNKAECIKLSQVDLAILLNLLNTRTSEGGVTDGSRNLQNLRDVFRSMLAHLRRRTQ